jgi:predicted RNase H-like nuclease
VTDQWVLGVDGCRAGWVGVVLTPGAPVRGVFGTHIGEIVEAASATSGASASQLAAVGVDMPLHLSDDGHRSCDLEARRHLGAKRSSLFVTPPRAALQAETYEEACAIARAATSAAPSRQAWALRTKVLELDAWWPTAPCPVHEVHPEVSFSAMTGAPILARKSTWAGLTARRAALADEGIVVPDDIGAAGQTAAADDVLDAAAVAWTARRIVDGEAVSFPDPPVDLGGDRYQAIWA